MASMTYGDVPGGRALVTSNPGLAAGPSMAGGGGDLTSFFMEMARRKQIADQQAQMAARRQQAQMMSKPAMMGGGGGSMMASDPGSAQKPLDVPWYSDQGAATRPVGMNPGMIPGMAVDTTKLPPWMRPEAAGFVGARSRVPSGTVESPDMDLAAGSAQNTNLPPMDPYERIRRQSLNQAYGR